MEDSHNVCSNCGTPFQNPNNPLANQNYYQNQNPYNYYPYFNQPVYPVIEEIGYGWIVLGFFFPIVGWITWGVWSKSRPKTALYSGIAGIIGFILGCILYMGNYVAA